MTETTKAQIAVIVIAAFLSAVSFVCGMSFQNSHLKKNGYFLQANNDGTYTYRGLTYINYIYKK